MDFCEFSESEKSRSKSDPRASSRIRSTRRNTIVYVYSRVSATERFAISKMFFFFFFSSEIVFESAGRQPPAVNGGNAWISRAHESLAENRALILIR